MDTNSKKAAGLVAMVSASLLAGAIVFQTLGYAPCEMCMWQRWAHVVAAVLASLSPVLRGRAGRLMLATAIAALATSGVIGIFHAGVEWKLWDGITTCAARMTSGNEDVLVAIVRAPLVRCDEAAWRMMGISMAGYNAIISLGAAAAAVIIMRARSSVGVEQN